MTYGRPWRREVVVMAAAAENSGPAPDLYRLLGVSRGASGGEIMQAWRRQALAEHPDRRPRDAAAPARFRALAECGVSGHRNDPEPQSLSASVQRAIPEAASTEAFAWTFTVITVSMSVGSACGGMIIQAAGTRAAFLAAGGCGLAGAASGALRLPGRHPQPGLKP
jgi:hypothetical protein